MSENNKNETQYLPTQLQQYIHLSRYARWMDRENRRETWPETVNRYVSFFETRFPGVYPTEMLRDAILNLKTMPSMRALMTAGPALTRDHSAGYNCSFLAIDHPKAFDEALFLLACGVGLGFSVERQSIAKLPDVADEFHVTDTVIVVRDSKIGWASAYRELITLLYSGLVPKWDVSKVRPAGARLKTFGGRASGPAPLEDLFRFTIDTFRRASGRKLNSVECHDLICKVADIIVVGGVRRSALISLSNLSDDRMRIAKSGQWWESQPQRALANNSAVYTEKPNAEIFMKEWLSLIESKSGERGIFNRVSAKKKAAESGRRDISYDFGTNPSLRGGTPILTDKGIIPIESLAGQEFNVVNRLGEVAPATCWLSGKDKQLIRLTLKNGGFFDATAEHKWPVISKTGEVVKITTDKLISNDKIVVNRISSLPYGNLGTLEDGFLVGFIMGDGWIIQRGDNGKSQIGMMIGAGKEWAKDRLEQKLESLGCNAKFALRTKQDGTKPFYELNTQNESLRAWLESFGMTTKASLPTTLWSTASEEFRKGFVDGLFSTDGSVESGSPRVSLVNKEAGLAKELEQFLGFYGIVGTVQTRMTTGNFPNGKDYGKTYLSYAWRVSGDNARHFATTFNLSHPAKADRLKEYGTYELSSYTRVVSVEALDEYEDVWDISVQTDDHCFQLSHCVTGNCGEILLRSCGFCNLTEVVIRSDDTLETLLAKVEAATIMGTFQSTLTDYRYLRPIWKKNAEEERLLGVSMTGIMDHPLLSHASDEAASWLQQLKDKAIEVNAHWAARLGINQSVAITTVKPSGTVSQLVDSASGIHARYAEFYVRTVRGDKKDPLAIMMRDMGFPVEDCVMKPETTDVFSFPVKGPAGGVFRNDMNAIEQLEHYLMFKEIWCEHNPSITVYVKDHEWLSVGAWVYDHFESIGGVSFLPHTEHSYRQAPYTEATPEEYEALLSKMPNVDWSDLKKYEKQDTTTGNRELACSAGVCELI